MTVKLLYFGDPHFGGNNPRSRTDDYKEATKAKIREIFQLAKDHQVNAIIEPGDTWDRPDTSISVLLEFADLLAESPVPIYTTAGNHDLFSYNLETYWRTSLHLLERLVPQFHVINDPAQPVYFGRHDDVQVTFTPYTGKMDRDGYGYSPENNNDHSYKIHVSHGMLLDHNPTHFDRYTYIGDVQTTANLVLTGHDHMGYGIYRRSDGVTFANIGSLTRLSASAGEIERPIQVLLFTWESPFEHVKLEEIPLKCARPGNEVLDRSKIEAEQERQYHMEQFSALIQTTNGERVLLDVDQIVETIAQQEGLPPGVAKLALEKIAEMRSMS